MVQISVGGDELTYERVAKTRSETVFEMMLVAESRTGELSIRQVELDIDAREDLSSDHIESALRDWQAGHENLTVHRVVVQETDRCAFATRVADPVTDADIEPSTDAATAAGASPQRAETQPLYRGGSVSTGTQVGFEDVDVGHGEEIEFHVAGPDTSVYGTTTGRVTDVKVGTDEHHVLIVETDDGTRRIREDWLVDGE